MALVGDASVVEAVVKRDLTDARDTTGLKGLWRGVLVRRCLTSRGRSGMGQWRQGLFSGQGFDRAIGEAHGPGVRPGLHANRLSGPGNAKIVLEAIDADASSAIQLAGKGLRWCGR